MLSNSMTTNECTGEGLESRSVVETLERVEADLQQQHHLFVEKRIEFCTKPQQPQLAALSQSVKLVCKRSNETYP